MAPRFKRGGAGVPTTIAVSKKTIPGGTAAVSRPAILSRALLVCLEKCQGSEGGGGSASSVSAGTYLFSKHFADSCKWEVISPGEVCSEGSSSGTSSSSSGSRRTTNAIRSGRCRECFPSVHRLIERQAARDSLVSSWSLWSAGIMRSRQTHYTQVFFSTRPSAFLLSSFRCTPSPQVKHAHFSSSAEIMGAGACPPLSSCGPSLLLARASSHGPSTY